MAKYILYRGHTIAPIFNYNRLQGFIIYTASPQLKQRTNDLLKCN